MVRKTRSTRRKPQSRRKANPAARSIATVEVQELESIRAEVERLARRLLATPLDVVGSGHRGRDGRSAAVYAARRIRRGNAAGT